MVPQSVFVPWPSWLPGFWNSRVFTRQGSQPHTWPQHGESGYLCFAPCSKPVWHGWLHLQLCCHLHSLQVNWCI